MLEPQSRCDDRDGGGGGGPGASVGGGRGGPAASLAKAMKLCEQVLNALKAREMDYISKVFELNKQGHAIPKQNVHKALTAFKICDDDEIQHLVDESEKFLADSDGLSFDAFVEILKTPSLLDQLSQSVPLWRLLSSAIPRKVGVSRIRKSAAKILMVNIFRSII